MVNTEIKDKIEQLSLKYTKVGSYKEHVKHNISQINSLQAQIRCMLINETNDDNNPYITGKLCSHIDKLSKVIGILESMI